MYVGFDPSVDYADLGDFQRGNWPKVMTRTFLVAEPNIFIQLGA